MRDMVSCFTEHAVKISETTCSSNHHHHLLPQQKIKIPSDFPAIQTSVSLIYKISLSSCKQTLVTVTWASSIAGPQALTVAFGDDPFSETAIFKVCTTSRLFRKKKGSKFIDIGETESKIELFWDLSEVTYGEIGAEPVKGYSILVTVDSEIALILGDLCRDPPCKKIKIGSLMAKNSLVSRKERFSGNTLFSTRARFSEDGDEHEISIRFAGAGAGEGLVVSLDKRTVMKVKRLQWNFRGNQTIFSDGLLIDLFWDVHDWFFSSGHGGLAVFMFRRRSGAESRLWMEEKMQLGKKKDDQDCKKEFSLLIYASKI